MNIEKCKLRREDESGKLAEAGFKWTELRLDLHWWYGAIVDPALGVGLCFLPLLFLLEISQSRWTALTALICAIAFSIFAIAQLDIFTKPLSVLQLLTFDATGPIRYAVSHYNRRVGPDGKFLPVWVELRWSIDEISSIEMTSEATIGGGHFKAKPFREYEYFSYAVVIYFANGESLNAARNLRPEDARIVAVQLNRALTDIRSVRLEKPRMEIA